MKSLNTKEFAEWLEGSNQHNEVFFIIIKSKTCVKCMKLEKHYENAFGEMIFNVASHTYNPGDSDERIAKIQGVFANLNLTAMPAIIFRYKEDGKWKYDSINEDLDDAPDYIDLRNIMDAIKDNDQSFFGFKNDEPVESDAKKSYNRLLHLIYGETDPEIVRERNLLRKEVTS